MHRCLVVIALILISIHACYAQDDFLQLKKRNKTIKSYFKNSYITFQTDGYQWLTGRIYKIKSDSIFLYQIDVNLKPSVVGFGTVIDTTVFGLVRLSFKNIRAIPNEHQSYLPKIGTMIQIGAVGYTALNLANAALQKQAVFDDANKKRLGGAVIAFLLGCVLKQTDPDAYRLGKKYKLVYVKLNP